EDVYTAVWSLYGEYVMMSQCYHIPISVYQHPIVVISTLYLHDALPISIKKDEQGNFTSAHLLHNKLTCSLLNKFSIHHKHIVFIGFILPFYNKINRLRLN